MNIIIRAAYPKDANDIALLSGQLGYHISGEQTIQLIEVINNSPNDVIRIAADGDKIVGWIQILYTTRLEYGSYCEITGLVIHEQYRGHGIGRLLMNDIKPWCKDKECERLLVRSNAKRGDAHQFYIRSGFTEVKEQKIFETTI